MPHLVSSTTDAEDTQPDTYEVTIDSDAMVESTPQDMGGGTCRLYFDLATYEVTTHTYSIVAVSTLYGDSAAATGSFTISPWRSLFRL